MNPNLIYPKVNTPLSFRDIRVDQSKKLLSNTLLDSYETIIFDLDGTIWDVTTKDGRNTGAYEAEPPFKLMQPDIVVAGNGVIIRLQKGIDELLRILDECNKDLGICSSGEKENTTFAAQPSIMLLKLFNLYKYFNYTITIKRDINKAMYVRPKGLTVYIDDDPANLDLIDLRGDVDTIDRRGFTNWLDLLVPLDSIFSSNKSQNLLSFGNETYFDSSPSEAVLPEERNFVNPLTDNKLRRNTPVLHDKAKDQLNVFDGTEDEVAERYNQTDLNFGLI